jgi:hypothetical protein
VFLGNEPLIALFPWVPRSSRVGVPTKGSEKGLLRCSVGRVTRAPTMSIPQSGAGEQHGVLVTVRSGRRVPEMEEPDRELFPGDL